MDGLSGSARARMPGRWMSRHGMLMAVSRGSAEEVEALDDGPDVLIAIVVCDGFSVLIVGG